jgi:predicted AAA+ superfamily ATPase
VDLLIDSGRVLVPFEVKLHSAPRAQDARGLKRCLEVLGLERGYVLYTGSEDYSLGRGIMALSVEKVLAAPVRVARL